MKNFKSINWYILFTLFIFSYSSYAQEKIVFVKNREIHSMNPDGKNIKQLTSYKVPGHTPISCRPSISKSGQVSYIYDPVKHGWMSTYTMALDGSNKKRISKEPKSKVSSTWNAVASPNGKYYVFVSTRSKNSEIYRMNADGSNIINISKSKAENGSPKWSPDSEKIIYVEDNDTGGSNIISTNFNGSDRTIIISSSDELKNVSYSKNGKMIAYSKVIKSYGDLMIADNNGENSRKLVSISKWSRVSFSSDNSSIAFVAKNDKIATIRLDGSNYKELTNGFDPVWSY